MSRVIEDTWWAGVESPPGRAVVLEGRSASEVARTYGVARSWVYTLVGRYRSEGDTAFEPRSRRPTSRPGATLSATVELVLALRRRLTRDGVDAGTDTIMWHLQHHRQITLSRATGHWIIRRADLITPEPGKKPRSSYIRFQAEQPNETWQADFTHHRLADGTDIEILTWLDDHSRYALSITAHRPVTGPAVVRTFQATIARHGTPFSTLTDNGLVFTTRFATAAGHPATASRRTRQTRCPTEGLAPQPPDHLRQSRNLPTDHGGLEVAAEGN